MSLFDDWEATQKAKHAAQQREAVKARPKNQKCSTCRFMLRHQFTDRINYCQLTKSTRTGSGFGKTNRTGWCEKWEGRL